jgi:hypothetical protein
VARQFLANTDDPRDVSDMTVVYSWVVTGSAFLVNDRTSGAEFVVAALAGRHPLRLNGNTVAISAFVTKQFNELFPGIGRLAVLARFLADVTVGPTAVVADAEFLSQRRNGEIRRWLGREKDVTVFEGLCTGVSAREEANEWRMQFNVFNSAGGVNTITVSGTERPFTIRQISVDELKPAGEFSYRMVG